MATAQLASVLQQLRAMVHAGAYEDTSDRELLERFLAQREEVAFVALLKRHGPMVLQVCRRIQGNEHDAEDAFQATFLLLARKASSIRKLDSVASWLHGVAQRLALQAKGKGTRRQARERRAADMRRTSGVSDESWQELRTTLDEALRQVPEKYRTPLLLCYLEGKTQPQAARQLGCPLGTIRSRLARGRNVLKDVLQRRGVCLSATALVAALAESGASASVPLMLLYGTARAALGFAAGRAATAVVSGQAAALVEGGLKAMLTAKIKIATALALAIGTLSIGAGAVASRVLEGLPQGAAQARLSATPEPRVRTGDSIPTAPEGPAGKESRQEITVRGQVLDADGKPLAGAKLLVPRASKPEPLLDSDVVMDSVGAAGADARFYLTLSPPVPEMTFYLIAYAAGFGVDWVDLRKTKPSDDVTFRLVKDVPITGRVVNTEGKPVAGVSVWAAAIYVPAHEKLDDYLSGWLKNLWNAVATPQKRVFGPPQGITGAVTTDKDGRFTINGSGAERIVQVVFAGGGVARSMIWVITRSGFEPKLYNDVLLKKDYESLRVLNRFLGLYAPSLTFVAEAGKTVEGVIKDAVSGKPLPGCRLFAQTGWGDGVGFVSDAKGKYRLDGLPKSDKGYSISVLPPKDTSYLNRTANAADTDGYAPVKLDIELPKGVVVTGRVVDKQTGKGVRTGIRFAPLPDNRFFGSKPGFDNYRRDRTMTGTDKDGRFRLVTIPGKALVTAQVHEGEKLNGEHLSPYRRAVADPDHKDLFKYDQDDDTWIITTADGSVEILDVEHAVKVIDIKEGEETKVELFVDRGVTARVMVQDADGKPLAGAWLAGLADHWPITYKLPEPTATVYALNPEKPRTLTVFHPEKKLGGTVTIRGDEKEPVVVKLGPIGTVIGRLLDADGNPLAGAQVSINARGKTAPELYRFASPTGKPVTADKDGRFTLIGVVPGISFYLQTQKGNSYFAGKPKIGLLQLKPGETRNLGDRTMELMR